MGGLCRDVWIHSHSITRAPERALQHLGRERPTSRTALVTRSTNAAPLRPALPCAGLARRSQVRSAGRAWRDVAAGVPGAVAPDQQGGWVATTPTGCCGPPCSVLASVRTMCMRHHHANPCLTGHLDKQRPRERKAAHAFKKARHTSLIRHPKRAQTGAGYGGLPFLCNIALQGKAEHCRGRIKWMVQTARADPGHVCGRAALPRGL